MRYEDDIELDHLMHPANPDAEVFRVGDRRRTPKDWTFGARAEAEAKFEERLENAKVQAAILPR